MTADKDAPVVRCLVPVSGGRDSQVCLKLALEHFTSESVRGLFCDTQFEHPITYTHIDFIARHYGVQIDRVCGGSVIEKTLKYGRFPGGGARHCTDELKIRETRIYCKTLAEKQGGFEVWYGMRSDESAARKKRYSQKSAGDIYFPHEVLPGKYPKYLGAMGVRFRLPILDWTVELVMQFLEGKHNPLYDFGFGRVGCFPCLAAGDAYKEKAFNFDATGAAHYQKVKETSAKIGKSIWTSRGGVERNENPTGCLICQI